MKMALGFAAALALAAMSAPAAQAQGLPAQGFALGGADSAFPQWTSGVRIHRGSDGMHGDGRRHRRGHPVFIGDFGYGYGGAWALYNNRSWRPDSYNDWWHERTERSFPRWMQQNEDCARPWYAADTLRC